MSQRLLPGYEIATRKGRTVKIKQYHREVRGGSLYVAGYNGNNLILKWYETSKLGNDMESVYENIKFKVEKQESYPEFLWPQDITELTDSGFGCIMNISPTEYYGIPRYILGKQTFQSYKTMADAALNIVSAFSKLHKIGRYYQDIDPIDVFLHPKDGAVRIGDSDNVLPYGIVNRKLMRDRHAAPELVAGREAADEKTQRYLIAMLLFYLFCKCHPLEGRRWMEMQLTCETQKKLYGSEALFLFDYEDKSNEANLFVQSQTIREWKELPDYMRESFLKAFSKESLLEKREKRPGTLEWMKALVRFRSEIVACSCGNETVVKQEGSCVCKVCGRKMEIPFWLEFRDYSIPGVAGTRIYQCQTESCSEEEALVPAGCVFSKQDQAKMLGIRNLTKNTWKAVTPSGKEKEVLPNEIVPLIDGISFTIGGQNVIIRADIEA